MKQPLFLYPADILLPNKQIDLSKFSVIACDQYTSQPDYWQRVKQSTQHVPSAYHLIFPEADLNTQPFAQKINEINQQMEQYLNDCVFDTIFHSLIYVERTLKNGSVRKGIIGMIDLEQYDYQKGAQSSIRATEETVLERIPPRVQIRKNACLELPHIMLLMDNPKQNIIEPLAQIKSKHSPLYEFELMEQSGTLSGWKIPAQQIEQLQTALQDLARTTISNQEQSMLFAVGDGNHSLAAAKACYEELKHTLSKEELKNHPARYALVEIVNLHDNSLVFEAIHRVVFDVDTEHLLHYLTQTLHLVPKTCVCEQSFIYQAKDKQLHYTIENPFHSLTVGSLQHCLDQYILEFGGTIDYIHGESVVAQLCQQPNTAGLILPCIQKSELFPTVIKEGSLPRKTFSMGEACDKRFYLEARKIR